MGSGEPTSVHGHPIAYSGGSYQGPASIAGHPITYSGASMDSGAPGSFQGHPITYSGASIPASIGGHPITESQDPANLEGHPIVYSGDSLPASTTGSPMAYSGGSARDSGTPDSVHGHQLSYSGGSTPASVGGHQITFSGGSIMDSGTPASVQGHPVTYSGASSGQTVGAHPLVYSGASITTSVEAHPLTISGQSQASSAQISSGSQEPYATGPSESRLQRHPIQSLQKPGEHQQQAEDPTATEQAQLRESNDAKTPEPSTASQQEPIAFSVGSVLDDRPVATQGAQAHPITLSDASMGTAITGSGQSLGQGHPITFSGGSIMDSGAYESGLSRGPDEGPSSRGFSGTTGPLVTGSEPVPDQLSEKPRIGSSHLSPFGLPASQQKVFISCFASFDTYLLWSMPFCCSCFRHPFTPTNHQKLFIHLMNYPNSMPGRAELVAAFTGLHSAFLGWPGSWSYSCYVACSGPHVY